MSQRDFGDPASRLYVYYPDVYYPAGPRADMPDDDDTSPFEAAANDQETGNPFSWAGDTPSLPRWMTDPLAPYNAGLPSFQPPGAPFPPQDTPFPPHDTFPQPQDTFLLPQGTPVPLPQDIPGPPQDESWPPRIPPKPQRPRWLVPGAVVLAGILAAGITYALTDGSPTNPPVAGPAAPGGTGPTGTGPAGQNTPGATQRSGAAPTAAATPGTGGQTLIPPVTRTAATAILANYTAINNTANAQESVALLSTYETQTSLALDSAIYRTKKANGSGPYPAFAPARANFYIPLGEAAYPHWFAAQATDVTLDAAHRLIGSEYLVFLQSAPGAPWREALEPYLVKGGAAPQVALGPQGYATAVGPDPGGLAVLPTQIASVTAASLDGTGPVQNPGNLADFADAALWRSRLPATVAITDRHMPAPGGFFGLRTADGGALLFYADAAEVTITPPPGQVISLTTPGLGGGAQHLTKASLRYLEQFAAYDPPRGGMTPSGASPRVIADFSGITGRYLSFM